jgi:hypothetical protein
MNLSSKVSGFTALYLRAKDILINSLHIIVSAGSMRAGEIALHSGQAF